MKTLATLYLAVFAATAAADVLDHDWWHTVSSSFDLYSDMKPAAAATLTDTLERFRVVADTLIPSTDVDAPPLRVIAFRNPIDFVEVFGMVPIAGLMQPSLQRHTLSFGPAGTGSGHAPIALHEYTHYLLRSRRALNLPVWYEEGFARLLSTTVFGESDATLGRVPVLRLRRAARSRTVSLGTLMELRNGLDWSRHDLPEIYEKSWALVHMLHFGGDAGGHDYSSVLPEILADIDQGSASALAFERHAGVSVSQLEAALLAYVKQRTWATRRLAAPPPTRRQFEQKRVARNDMALLLASTARRHNRHLAASELDRILREEPQNVDAMVALSRVLAHDRVLALELTSAALKLQPNHVDANIRMADLAIGECPRPNSRLCLGDWPAAITHYSNALAADATRLDAVLGLGVVALHQGQPEQAVRYIERAHRRAPWAPRINFYLGEAYRLTGDSVNARRHLGKAVHWGAAESWRRRADMALALLGPD